MKTIKLSELDNLIQKYCKQSVFSKPLLLWFASSSTAYDVRIELLNDSANKSLRMSDGAQIVENEGKIPELWSQNIPVLTDDIKRIIYGEDDFKCKQSTYKFYIDLMRNKQLPLICLVNDYAMKEKDAVEQSILDECYEQCFVLERTYEEWRNWMVQTGGVLELVKYMDNHKDLFFYSPAYDDKPKEAVHTIEPILNRVNKEISNAIKYNSKYSRTIDETVDDIIARSYVWDCPKNVLDRDDFRQMLHDYIKNMES